MYQRLAGITVMNCNRSLPYQVPKGVDGYLERARCLVELHFDTRYQFRLSQKLGMRRLLGPLFFSEAKGPVPGITQEEASRRALGNPGYPYTHPHMEWTEDVRRSHTLSFNLIAIRCLPFITVPPRFLFSVVLSFFSFKIP